MTNTLVDQQSLEKSSRPGEDLTLEEYLESISLHGRPADPSFVVSRFRRGDDLRSVAASAARRSGPQQPVVRKTRRAPLRTAVGRSFGKWIALGLVVVVVALAAVPLVGFIAGRINPMAVEKVDRTQPALLAAISGLSDYRAASAQFSVVVDVEEDAKWLPAALRGERTVLLASGSVDAGVDLSVLNERAIVIDEITKSVMIFLPGATLRKAQLDLDNSTVMQHKRGLFDRIGSALGDAPTGDNEAFRLAQKKLEAAAKASTVVATAETNTRAMMTSLVRGLGYENVTVVFEASNSPRFARESVAPSPPK